MSICATCTASHARVTRWRQFPCQHDSGAILHPLYREQLSLPADSVERAPQVDIVTLSQLHEQGRDIYRRTVGRSNAWSVDMTHRAAIRAALLEPWGGVTLGADGVVERSDGYAVAVHSLGLGVPAYVRAPYLGVFRDEEAGRVDFDAVVIVDSLREAQALSVYVAATGGAYSFADGNGYWTPTLAS